jgi:hypothetical protein
MSFALIVSFMIVLLATLAGITTAFTTKKSDGPIEELCEEIIKDQTGIDIDLTPGSSEENSKK